MVLLHILQSSANGNRYIYILYTLLLYRYTVLIQIVRFARVIYFLAKVRTANGYHSSCDYVIKHSDDGRLYKCYIVRRYMLFRVCTMAETVFICPSRAQEYNCAHRVVAPTEAVGTQHNCFHPPTLISVHFVMFRQMLCAVAKPVGI